MDEQFAFIVSFFAGWGWQSLGKIPNPSTGKEEKNIPMAGEVIRVLESLRNKTKGNLSPDEQRMLDAAIADLQLNFADESTKKETPPAGDTQSSETPEPSA